MNDDGGRAIAITIIIMYGGETATTTVRCKRSSVDSNNSVRTCNRSRNFISADAYFLPIYLQPNYEGSPPTTMIGGERGHARDQSTLRDLDKRHRHGCRGAAFK